MKRTTTAVFCAILAVSVCFAEDEAEEREMILRACRDVWISSCKGQDNTSMSRTQVLKLAGLREMALLGYDCAQLTGKRIAICELYLHQVSVEELFPKKLVVSTVSSEWMEGRFSVPYREDPVGSGASFREASYGSEKWAGPGSSVMDVAMGNGNSLLQKAVPMPVGGRWWKIRLDDNIVKALVTESSSGLLVTGEWDGIERECFVHSRESGIFTPYLRIEWEHAQEIEIPSPKVFAEREMSADGVATGRIKMSIEVPENIFSYEILIDGDPIPRWQIPFAAGPGTRQVFVIDGPKGDVPVPVRVFAVGEHGDPSESVRVRADIPIPTIPAPKKQGR